MSINIDMLSFCQNFHSILKNTVTLLNNIISNQLFNIKNMKYYCFKRVNGIFQMKMDRRTKMVVLSELTY